MPESGDKEPPTRGSVAVVDRQVPETGWQQIDLARTLGGLPPSPPSGRGAAPGSMTASVSASILAFPGATTALIGAFARAAFKKVPSTAFVSIGRTAGAPAPKRRVKSRSANDNMSAEQRSVWRDLFFLAILAATVAGAFWSGRVHGLQKVIVVPGPSSFYSVVT